MVELMADWSALASELQLRLLHGELAEIGRRDAR